MLAIKDMEEMPSGCDRCRLYPVCKHRDVYNDNYKPTDCPLVEIVTCKDCKHKAFLASDGKGNTTYMCNKHCKRITNDDFYCADAERKE